MAFDYAFLKCIWWLFVGVLLVGFAIMDGQDMGVGTLLPFLTKKDSERRIMINSVAPHWDGNQVWFITAGGAVFAAWPMVYATAFSGLYWALLIVLFALLFRPVGFDYRSKLEHSGWRNTWDWLLFVGSVVPPIICGVAFGNLLLGLPFHLDESLRSFYTGSFFALLSPFALLCGVISLLMIVTHGANYLALRTVEPLKARAVSVSRIAGFAFLVLFVLAGVWVYVGVDGYTITSTIDPNALPNPLGKTVEVAAGAWFANYNAHPLLYVIPALAVVGAVASCLTISRCAIGAIVFSAVSMLGTILTPLVAMFPFIMPSSTVPNTSLTMWDCTSSEFTLTVMFCVTLVFLPIVLVYTGWAYRVMRGKLTDEYIADNDHALY